MEYKVREAKRCKKKKIGEYGIRFVSWKLNPITQCINIYDYEGRTDETCWDSNRCKLN